MCCILKGEKIAAVLLSKLPRMLHLLYVHTSVSNNVSAGFAFDAIFINIFEQQHFILFLSNQTSGGLFGPLNAFSANFAYILYGKAVT